ncbi:MAG: hypothetical protein DCF19_09030 [Pseudanabaena frigida]|uniref:DUF928 domain-containing protein n=1 Tax=Pseudanabaena frigida TaxID=945775 RepID=A0A2W4W9D4_9CYAN|nr:MAG: hypothetical protein DCF19_09030 [Pseudanabaena frigida]
MNQIKSRKYIIPCFCGVVLAANTILAIATPQFLFAEELSIWERLYNLFASSHPQGEAGSRQDGGARRDRCPTVTNPLMAIAPIDVKGNLLVGRTISDRPTFWFYVPYSPAARRRAEFVIIDDKEEDFYSATFMLDRQPGIASLQLPSTAQPFKDGKKYQWVFSVICNPINRSGDATVNGWIEKVPVSKSLNIKLKTATPKDLITIHTDLGLWNDTLTALANFGKENPENTDFQSSWIALQSQFGLKNFHSKTWITYALPEIGLTNNNSAPPQSQPTMLPVQTIIDNLRNMDLTPIPKTK